MKIDIKIPTELSDIKLSDYQKYLRTTEGSEDVNFINRQLVSIFCKIPDEHVGKILAKDYNGLIDDITKVLNKEPQLVTRFKKDGVEYGFIPKLDDITVGEKADLDTFLGDIQKLDQAMKVLYRPIISQTKDKYLIDEYKKESEDLDVTLDIALGAMVFFYNLMKDLLSFTQNYIEEAVQEPKVSQLLAKNGVGIKTFTHSLEEVFSGLKMSLN